DFVLEFENGGRHHVTRNKDLPGSLHCNLQALERGTSVTSADVRIYRQFEGSGGREFNTVILTLIHRSGRTEVPLLAHDVFPRASAVLRPSQHKFLSASKFLLFENQPNARYCLWFVEQQPDSLNPWGSSTPAPLSFVQ